MARTQAADYDQKRERIIASAAQLFALNGFGGASLSEIAKHANLSKSLIYHYFRSKEMILFNIMSTHIDDLLSVCEEISNRSVDQEERLRGFSRVMLRHYVGAADSQKILLYEINNLSDDQRCDIIAKQRRIIKFAEGLLLAARPSHHDNRATLRTRIMLFFGMLNWTHNWYRADGPVSRDAIADMASDTLLKSVSR